MQTQSIARGTISTTAAAFVAILPSAIATNGHKTHYSSRLAGRGIEGTLTQDQAPSYLEPSGLNFVDFHAKQLPEQTGNQDDYH